MNRKNVSLTTYTFSFSSESKIEVHYNHLGEDILENTIHMLSKENLTN